MQTASELVALFSVYEMRINICVKAQSNLQKKKRVKGRTNHSPDVLCCYVLLHHRRQKPLTLPSFCVGASLNGFAQSAWIGVSDAGGGAVWMRAAVGFQVQHQRLQEYTFLHLGPFEDSLLVGTLPEPSGTWHAATSASKGFCHQKCLRAFSLSFYK